jgi:hypothetical protein
MGGTCHLRHRAASDTNREEIDDLRSRSLQFAALGSGAERTSTLPKRASSRCCPSLRRFASLTSSSTSTAILFRLASVEKTRSRPGIWRSPLSRGSPPRTWHCLLDRLVQGLMILGLGRSRQSDLAASVVHGQDGDAVRDEHELDLSARSEGRMTNKERFAALATLARIPNATLADRCGKRERVVEAWRGPAHHKMVPPDWSVALMQSMSLDTLRRDAVAAGYDLISRKRTA